MHVLERACNQIFWTRSSMESFSNQPWRDRGYHKDDSYHPAAGRQNFQGLLPTPSDGQGTRYPDPSKQRSWPRADNVQRWEVFFPPTALCNPALARVCCRWETDEEKWPSTYQPSPHAHQENGYVEVCWPLIYRGMSICIRLPSSVVEN